MSQHFSLNANGYTIDFYIFIDDPGAEAKVAGLRRYFERMPQQHLAVVYPIFVIDYKPARGPGGGTWRPGEVRSTFMGPHHQQNTHVPDEEVQRLIVDQHKGLIGIPRERWERPLDRLKFTVIHEVGHSVDYGLGLASRWVTPDDFRGVRPTCGAGSSLKRYVVEAYARFIINPADICRDEANFGERDPECSQRVISALRRSPAFRVLPPDWMPQ
jgi:hypothetical protein